ncbi:MAG TPA: ATP-binding protein [Gemmataceae bacterium]|nr:ATP-binding protein [Gemmataceae bacterium]
MQTRGSRQPAQPIDASGEEDLGIAAPPEELFRQVQAEVNFAGGELAPDPDREGSIGATMFDSPGSDDDSVTVLLPREHSQQAPSQSLVRIKSRDGRKYLGIVTAGPFAEPDTLRADSHLLVTVTARGGIYLPPYHGRVTVAILGEELENGALVPPRLRPLPNSPVVPLTTSEVADVLRTAGDIRLGSVVGASEVIVNVPSDKKAVLPRHLAVLGTTGGGKSTTISRLIQQGQAAGMAVILLDVEGEYTQLHEQTDNAEMLEALRQRGLEAEGIPAEHMRLYHLVGRDTKNPIHPNRIVFSLQFAQLSPFAVAEMLGMNDAQESRFRYAYDATKAIMRDVGICPEKNKPKDEIDRQEQQLLRVDEFDRGWPRMTLSLLLDTVGKCHAVVSKASFEPYNSELRSEAGRAALDQRIKPKEMEGNASSWGKLKSLLWRMHRLKVFDRHLVKRERAKPINYRELLEPGRVSVIDLSDTGMTELANFAIADLLRGIQSAQEVAYRRYEEAKRSGETAPPPPRVLLILEEAHEFLSAERIDRMDTLFQQLARIAKRGRKRWLSLAFVTQLPQHLPRQIYGLVNSYILHKITDAQVVRELQRTVSGIDESLWKKLPGLAPGQAIVSFPHLARPLLVAVDPSPCKLGMVD